MNHHSPLPDPGLSTDSGLSSAAVFMRVLGFLVDVSESQMALHQKSRASDSAVAAGSRSSSSSFAGLLDFADLHMDCLWRLLEAVDKRSSSSSGSGIGSGDGAHWVEMI